MTDSDTAALDGCGCDWVLMAALSPMHPLDYIEAACDEHRRMAQESSPAPLIRDYVPHNEWRSATDTAAS